MEDYDGINEMHNIKEKIVMFVETDENLYEEIKNICECIPLRFSYDLSKFSEKYIDNTKGLFTFYYNNKNTYNNELLRIKKHFKHYNRSPFILYVNKDNDNYLTLKKIFDDLNIECVTNKKLFVKKIKNNKKLFLIDSDETLRNSKGIISEKNKLGIKKILSNNDYAVICTARPRYHTLDIMNQVHASNYIISSNGAELYDVKKDKIINSYFLSKSDLYKIIKESYKNEVRLVLTLEDYDYVTKNIRNKNQKLLDEKKYKEQIHNKRIKTCMVIDEKIDKIILLKEMVIRNKNLCIINEKNINDNYCEHWFTIGNSKANKGTGAIDISNYLNIPLKNVISIGNDYNDLPMFKKSGISFAVENADTFIKNNASLVVSSNNDSGVSQAIDYIYKNNGD